MESRLMTLPKCSCQVEICQMRGMKAEGIRLTSRAANARPSERGGGGASWGRVDLVESTDMTVPGATGLRLNDT